MSLFSQMTTTATLRKVTVGKSATSAPTKTTREEKIKVRFYELSAAERAVQNRDGTYSLFAADMRPTVDISEKDEIIIDLKKYRVNTIKQVKKGGSRVNHLMVRMDLVE